MARSKPAVRTETLFDADWRFLLGDADGAERPEFKGRGWRKLDLPHDWSLEDLPPAPPTPYAAQPVLSVVAGPWRFHKGDDPAWKLPDLDDSAWQPVTLPDTWERHSNYTEDNVYGWYRRRLDVPAALKGREAIVLLGAIDDVDEAFLNGQRIGGTGTFPPAYLSAWNLRRKYVVPAGLLRADGTDVLAVRVFDGPGTGGIYADDPVPARSGPFDTVASPGNRDSGYVLGGTAWYRKHFTLRVSDEGRRVSVRFDGVYMNADVWLNGRHLGQHPYGYTSFAFDLTPHLRPAGAPNVLAVRVRNEGRNTRWYSGSGIYRHVWLTLTGAVHVPLYGVTITTPKATRKAATVNVGVTVENARDGRAAVGVRVRLIDADGRTAAQRTTRIRAAGYARVDAQQALAVAQPRLWSTETPNLYRAEVALMVGERVVDQVAVPFGIRTVRIDAAKGFRLNGAPLKLKGGCIHHDNGPLGAVALDRADERRVEVLKANGFNAIRCAHNPPSPGFLDACDRLGVLVMDEAFDMWLGAKNPQDYHRVFESWWRADLESMVRRDRNHPSVVFWSIGNEIMDADKPEVAAVARMLADEVRALDPTRPVTSAVAFGEPWERTDDFIAALDVAGYNYRIDRYAIDHKRRPERVVACTESFPPKAFDYWMGVLDYSNVIGDFVWTGMDYLGESGIGYAELDDKPAASRSQWPYHASWCGDLDLCGFKKPQSHYRDVLWGRSRLELMVHRPLPAGRQEALCAWGWPDEEPSWTWPGCEGRRMQVAAYSTCEQVRLLLNGREIGLQPVSRATRFTAVFDVPYAPGELRAVGLVGGREATWLVLQTAGEPVTLRLTPDRRRIRADRNDLAYVTVEAVDSAGRLVPYAASAVRFAVRGVGELAAVGNGNPKDPDSYCRPERRLFRGRCLAILRPTGVAGVIRLRAEADGLAAAATDVAVD